MENKQNLYVETHQGHDSEYGEFSRLAEDLAGCREPFVVGILDEPHWQGSETPPDLTPRCIGEVWSGLPGVKVVYLNADQISSYALLSGNLNVLVLPYGSRYRMDAYGLYSGQAFDYFIKKGGAILTTGGIPFMNQSGSYGDSVLESIPPLDVYDKWVAKFGIKYYRSQYAPSRSSIRTDLLPSLTGAAGSFMPSPLGVVVNNSSHAPVPKPPHGNVFPERYPARSVVPLMTATNRFGEALAVNAVLVQDYENGSRRIHFTHEGGNHPLSPAQPHFKALVTDLFQLLAQRTVVKDVRPNYACYREDETVRLEIETAHYGDENIQIEIRILDHDQTVYQSFKDVPCDADPGSEWPVIVKTHDDWAPPSFESDEYRVVVQIHKGGQVVSEGYNGFVVWKPDVLARGNRLRPDGHYFALDDKKLFLAGTNYYESTRGEIMWFRPAADRIISDYRQMASCGVRHIRPHYHHLKWFKDYLMFFHGALPDFYQELQDVSDPMPDERAWRIFDLFIYLSQKYGIVYGGDLFTLVCSEMGDPRGWFGTVQQELDTACRPVQKAFLQAIDLRYIDVPGIAWDLFNEPCGPPESATNAWAMDLRQVLDANGSGRPVTVGGPRNLGASIDYDSPHGRPGYDTINAGDGVVFLQEVHLDVSEELDAELEQAEMMREVFTFAIRGGMAGVSPWSWTRQQRLWQDTYEHHHTFPMEKWDDRLGQHTHDDATLKPSGRVYQTLAQLLGRIELDRYESSRCVVKTRQGELVADVVLEEGRVPETPCMDRRYSIYHHTSDGCLAAMAFNEISDEGRCLVKGETCRYLYMFTVDGLPFHRAAQIAVRADVPGNIIISRPEAKRVQLAAYRLDGFEFIEDIPFEREGDDILVKTDDDTCPYWLVIE